MESPERDNLANHNTSLTGFIENNQRLLAVLSVFVAVIVVSGQIESAWANVFRGTFVLLAMLVWLELLANHSASGDWQRMPGGSLHPKYWLGGEQRMYWFGILMVVGFVLFCVYLAVTFPVTALYVLLAVVHAPIHVILRRQLSRATFVRNRSDKFVNAVGVLSGVLSLMLLAGLAVLAFTVARSIS